MDAFKQLMGFFMMGTVVVLAWIFGRQAGNDARAPVGRPGRARAGRLAVRSRRRVPRRARAGSLTFAALCLAAGLFLGLHQAGRQRRARRATRRWPQAGDIAWQTYTPESLGSRPGGGPPVFIDFTAAWCLSCQVNERLALRSAGVQQRFRDRGIVAFKADWTLYDERITEALRSYSAAAACRSTCCSPRDSRGRGCCRKSSPLPSS